MKKNEMKQQLRTIKPINFLILLAAGIINAIGVTMFLAPAKLYDSGFSGTSMLLGEVSGVSLSLFLILLNIPFFIYGLKKQGIVFTVYSVYAVVVYSVAAFLITDVLPVDVADSSPFAGTDVLLCAIFGGVISGVGSGMTIRFGGAIDGVEVMAVIFAKRLGITVGTFVMIYNVVLYVAAGVIMGSWLLPLYSIIAYCAALKSVDFIVEGLDKAKSVMIVTTKEAEISAELSQTFGKGITHFDAEGYYSGENKTVIYFVVNRFQIAKLKNIVSAIDPAAFVTISEVTDVMGRSVK